MKAELQQLVALQNLDTSIRKLQSELQAIPERRAEIESEFDQRAFEIRAMEERRDNARHERTRLEAEIFEQKQRAERADRKHECNTPRCNTNPFQCRCHVKPPLFSIANSERNRNR